MITKVTKNLSYGTIQSLIPVLNSLDISIRDVLSEAIIRTGHSFDKILKKRNDDVRIININNALTDLDKRGALILDEKGNFTYSSEGLLNKNKEVLALDDKVIEVTIYECLGEPRIDDLSLDIRILLEGTILKELSLEEPKPKKAKKKKTK